MAFGDRRLGRSRRDDVAALGGAILEELPKFEVLSRNNSGDDEILVCDWDISARDRFRRNLLAEKESIRYSFYPKEKSKHLLPTLRLSRDPNHSFSMVDGGTHQYVRSEF